MIKKDIIRIFSQINKKFPILALIFLALIFLSLILLPCYAAEEVVDVPIPSAEHYEEESITIVPDEELNNIGLVVPDYSLKTGTNLNIKEGKTIFEIRIYDSGEGIININGKKGKINYFNMELNIDNMILLGEDYYIHYTTSVWSWGVFHPHQLTISEPQSDKKNITEIFFKEVK